MPRKLLPALVLGLVLFSAAPALAGGDIYVGGPWGTNIQRLPYTITAPGAYYLSGNLSYAGTGNGITIAPGVNHVTLDLMGFTINGSGSGNYGIYLNGSKNVEIRNGTLSGWFAGIEEIGESGRLHRIINVRVMDKGGIILNGSGHMIKGCEVTSTSGTGDDSYTSIWLRNGTVSGCTVKFTDAYGIAITSGIIRDNVVISTGTDTGNHRWGINAAGSPGILAKGNKVSGCYVGIRVSNGVNVIGNTVDAASGTTGFYLNDDYSILLDQNTVTGPGTPYSPSTFSNAARRSNYPVASSP